MPSVSFHQSPQVVRPQIIPNSNDKTKVVPVKRSEPLSSKTTYVSTTLEGILQPLKPWDIGAENKKYDFSHVPQNPYTEYALRKDIQSQCSFEERRSVSETSRIVKEHGEIWEGTFNKEGLLHGDTCALTAKDGSTVRTGRFDRGVHLSGKITLKGGETQEGNFKDWVLHGPNGKMTLEDGETREGAFENGVLHGPNCTIKTADGDTFEGYFNQGKFISGKLTSEDGGIREGSFVGPSLFPANVDPQNNVLHGDNCVLTLAGGPTRVGRFYEGGHVSGKVTFKNGETWEGTFENELLHGPDCIITRPDGFKAEARFSHGRIFSGKIRYPSGDTYEGTFRDRELHGPNCTIKKVDGSIYEGRFESGKFKEGKMTFPDGTIQEGAF